MRPSRRSVLALLPSASLGAVVDRAPVLASDTRRFVDAATENTVLRLTDPAYSSHLLPVTARPFLQRGDGLLYVSDRTGTWQAFRMEVRSGQSRQLTKCAALVPDSVALSADARYLYFIDGETLQQAGVGSQRIRVLDRREDGWQPGGPLTVSDDGSQVATVDEHDGFARLRVLPTRNGTPVNLLQVEGSIRDIAFRPRSSMLSCRREDGRLYLLSRGRAPEPVGSSEGKCGASLWSADGSVLLYLHMPERGQYTIREYVVANREDRVVSATSQFVQFSRNSDASVFAGLSGLKASPYVLLLVRRARREFTLCEHRASDATRQRILFSPNSQRVYFGSDRFGKPTIQEMNVDRLVALTEEE